ncbi:hypothetical protein AB0H12_20375 [Actinosynnema sp. NPDC023794]
MAAAREVLDEVNADRLREWHEVFEQRTSQSRTATDVAAVLRFTP